MLSLILFAAVLTLWITVNLHFSFWMALPVFLVTFCAEGLLALYVRGGRLLRCLAVPSMIVGIVAAVWKESFWTFLWVFTLTDVVLILLAFGYLVWVCGRVDLSEPQAEHDDPFYRRVMNLYIRALMDLVLVRAHYTGLEKIPTQERFLLVCNHLFLADPGILLDAFPKSQLAFITKQENQKLPIINKFMHKILCQNLDREDDRQALKVILKCIQLMKNDEVSIGVFPEGYTSRDGKLHHFRSGVFKIAQKTKAPIVVCTIQNTQRIFSNLKRLRPTDVELHLVEVIGPEAYEGMTTVALAEMVYEKMIGDLGEGFRVEED